MNITVYCVCLVYLCAATNSCHKQVALGGLVASRFAGSNLTKGDGFLRVTHLCLSGGSRNQGEVSPNPHRWLTNPWLRAHYPTISLPITPHAHKHLLLYILIYKLLKNFWYKRTIQNKWQISNKHGFKIQSVPRYVGGVATHHTHSL